MKAARFPLLLACGLLAGCGSLLGVVQRQPFTIYAPSYHAPAQTGPTAKVDWQLVVETPLSSETLNTSRIVVMPSPGVIEVYPGARWSDPAPTLLRNLVVQGFEQSGRIIGVGANVSGLSGDYALAIDLHAFQAEIRSDGPHAVLRFQARLLDYRNSRVMATRAFAADTPFPPKDTAAAFAAFEASTSGVISELVDWTLQAGTAAQKAR